MEGYAGDGCWGEGGDVRFKGFGGVNFVDGGHVYFWSVLGGLVVWGNVSEDCLKDLIMGVGIQSMEVAMRKEVNPR